MMRLVNLYQGGTIQPGALEFLYELMKIRQEEPYVNISNRELPTPEQHRAFWTRRPYRFVYLIEDNALGPAGAACWLGYISATDRNEIGIVLMPHHRGKGNGMRAVALFTATHQPLPAEPSVRAGRWLANINPRNAKSIAMFKRLGFREIQVTYELDQEEENHAQGSGKPA